MFRSDLVQVIREFTGTIINPFDLDELLYRLMDHATEVVDVAGAGVMLADDDGELGFVAASQEQVVEAEQHQARLQTGACFHAYMVNDIVVVEDLAAERRWPDYARHVLDLGLRSVLGVPMNAFGQTIGVINFYRSHASSWSEEDVGVAEIITAMGAGYILNANQLRAQHAFGEQLRSAVDSRDLIGQAKGILMVRDNVDADAALALLRRRADEQGLTLRELSRKLVTEHENQAADG